MWPFHTFVSSFMRPVSFSWNVQWHFIKEENHLSNGEKQDDNLKCLALPGSRVNIFWHLIFWPWNKTFKHSMFPSLKVERFYTTEMRQYLYTDKDLEGTWIGKIGEFDDSVLAICISSIPIYCHRSTLPNPHKGGIQFNETMQTYSELSLNTWHSALRIFV